MTLSRRLFVSVWFFVLAAGACDGDPVADLTGAGAVVDRTESLGGAGPEWIRGIDLRPEVTEVVGSGFGGGAGAGSSSSYAVLAAAGAAHTVTRTSTATEVEITFGGLNNYDAVPKTAYASFPNWIAHIDMDEPPGYPVHTGNFANEPSPSSAIFWYYQGAASKAPSSRDIDFDRPVSHFSLYYAACLGSCLPPPRRGETRPPTLPHITLIAYDAAGAVVDSVKGNENYDQGSGDPTGAFNRWDRLQVAVGENDNRITKVRITGYEEYVGVDDVGYLIVNFAPVAVPGGPYTGSEGSPVAFNGSVSYDPVDATGLPHSNGDPVTYQWDFGDGGTATTAKPSHTYANSGTYTATLTVTDPNLVPHTATATVIIANVAPTVNAGSATGSVGGGEAFTRAGSFTDPGGDEWTATVDYGDGGGPQPLLLTPAKTFTLSHAYATRGEYAVVVTVDDGDGGVGTAEIAVTVGNRAPQVDAGADATLPEGSFYTASVSFTDPDVGESWTATVDYGDGTGPQAVVLSGMGFSLNHAYDDDGIYTVTVTVDDGADVGTDQVVLTVTNVAPTASFDATAAVAGDPVVVSFSGAVDVSPADVAAGFTYAFDCGGGYGAFSANPSASCPTSAPGPLTVKGKVRDKDGGATEYSATVNVGAPNQPPTAAIDGPATGAEGQLLAFSAAASVDPEDGALTHAWSFGDGHTATGESTSHVYADDGTFALTLTVTDEGGLTHSVTKQITIANLPPTATLAAPTNVLVGEPFTLALAGAGDPSPADVAAGFTYAFDCGTGFGTFGAASSRSCTAGAEGQAEVAGRIRDKDGGVSAYTGTVTITRLNRAPTVSIDGPSSASEGSSLGFSAVASDPDGDALTYSWNFGDGALATGSSATHAYADEGSGSYTITLTVSDGRGGVAVATHLVSVANVAPTATFSAAPTNVTVGRPFTLSLTGATDPSPVDAAAGFTFAFDCGAGAGYGTFGTASTATCATSTAGTHSVRGRVRDKDGGVREYTAAVTVSPPAVTVIPVSIDVKPEKINLPKDGRAPNGELTVHVYAHPGFDLADIERFAGSITLGDGVGTDTPPLAAKSGDFKITGGKKHIVIHFSRAALFHNGDLTTSTTRLTLKASLFGGTVLVQGWDDVRITRK